MTDELVPNIEKLKNTPDKSYPLSEVVVHPNGGIGLFPKFAILQIRAWNNQMQPFNRTIPFVL